MAPRLEKITIGKSSAASASDDSAEHHDEKRPRNLPAVSLAQEGFSVMVDGKAKSHYLDAASAMKAGLALKTAYPVIQVAIYDSAEKTRNFIELPGAPAKAPPRPRAADDDDED